MPHSRGRPPPVAMAGANGEWQEARRMSGTLVDATGSPRGKGEESRWLMGLPLTGGHSPSLLLSAATAVAASSAAIRLPALRKMTAGALPLRRPCIDERDG